MKYKVNIFSICLNFDKGEDSLLTFSFFTALILSASWIACIAQYVRIHLVGISFNTIGLIDLSAYAYLTLLPLLIIWLIFGYVCQFIQAKRYNKQMLSLFHVVKQNQEYSDIIAKILIENGRNASSDFVIGKIDLFIGEMNEMLSDILQRYSLLGEEKIGKLWKNAERGNHWGFAKAIIELKSSVPDFENKIFTQAQSQAILSGTIFEFCSRYNKLLDLLKKYDNQRIFVEVVETGAFGRVFTLFNHIAERLCLPEEKELVANEPLISMIETGEAENKIEEFFQELPQQAEPEMSKSEDVQSIIEILSEINTVEQSPEILLETLEEIEDMVAQVVIEETQAISNIAEKVEQEEGFFSHIDKELSKEKYIAPQYNEEEEKKFNLPKLGGFFKNKRKSPEPEKARTHEIDSLTLALERSFGKLADNNKEKLFNIKNADGSKLGDLPTNDRFAFASTNKTIKNLQKEWQDMKKGDHKETDNEEETAKEGNDEKANG